MPFWTLDKKTNTPAIYGSIAIMSKHVGVSANTLYYYFSRKGAKEFENKEVRIVKTDVVRSSRS